MRKIYLLLSLLLLVSACNAKVKETIGIEASSPDEHQVKRNKPLDIPPHYDIVPIEKKDPKTSSCGCN